MRSKQSICIRYRASKRLDWNEHRGGRAEPRAQLLKHLIIVGVIARDCIRYRLYFHSRSRVRANDRYRRADSRIERLDCAESALMRAREGARRQLCVHAAATRGSA